ncbi:MAG: glutamate synthase large subunit [Acidobacteria bacterium]|nr:glutamate synthase large subunit [Acidobacteriota bacterium]MCB9398007.1 glutamate synthase large subunit [Acidobacteriota bacterium]
MFLNQPREHAACGVGFLVNRHGQARHETLTRALSALTRMEHRGACAADNVSGDGSGVMTEIPFPFLGFEPGSVAVAMLFMPVDPGMRQVIYQLFEDTFAFMDLKILKCRDVPIDPAVLGPIARQSMPVIRQAIISRPKACRTDVAFNQRLYLAKQATRSKARQRGISSELFFASLSTSTIVYKAMTRAEDLARFYPDLTDPAFKTRYALIHRRFSTNTRSTWDKAQPFRLIAHNGEINTIAGNRSWSYSREQSMGLAPDELLTRHGISDSGSLNEMVEALKYRSSMPRMADILAIMIPPAQRDSAYYTFWGRALEPWDGPALIAYCDGKSIGARLDRNGFRPCRWIKTAEWFGLASEAGPFELPESEVLAKGILSAGQNVTVDIARGEADFSDPSETAENKDYPFSARLISVDPLAVHPFSVPEPTQWTQFGISKEDLDLILKPMIETGKEPIGSMGDTARAAILSELPRNFFDFFYQNFAQVTNPPLDYLRERIVTDLTTQLNAHPNVFEPKELLPPKPALVLKSPVLGLGTMEWIKSLQDEPDRSPFAHSELDLTFPRDAGVAGFTHQLEVLGREAVEAVQRGASLLVLSDRNQNEDRAHLPALLGVRAVVTALNREGLRLKTSLVVHSGQILQAHHVACLIGFGATAVCPYLALAQARHQLPAGNLGETHLRQALEQGLLKIMARAGISVVRSYQSAKLFTSIGLHRSVMNRFFPGLTSPIGGFDLDDLARMSLRPIPEGAPEKFFLFREHGRGELGEKHAMTNRRAKLLHQLLAEPDLKIARQQFKEWRSRDRVQPIHIRDLFQLQPASPKKGPKVETVKSILSRFGSGAMSFGALNAEAQRDIFKAMHAIGGRSNSGEGGDNPYAEAGIEASIKQIASGRFGVTAQYLARAEEIQIKIAQGAKPGEGGQLMGVKVDAAIAKARHAPMGVSLISPPPLHDLYSIEDLKELIYELKQFRPTAKVSVKLTAGSEIGTIAVGVAKAGADIIHISGGDGGTGAAALSSMKHAGLPWELGLYEVHRSLVQQGLRSDVTLRVDGGLQRGEDLIKAAIWGAEQFDFGKILMIAEGCVMARICEKNTCPVGIATHDPKFKAKYKGQVQDIVRFLRLLAEEVQNLLKKLKVASLESLIGRTDLLAENPHCADLIQDRHINLSELLTPAPWGAFGQPSRFGAAISELNRRLEVAYEKGTLQKSEDSVFSVSSNDRAVLTHLSGVRAAKRDETPISVQFTGSAGQGFGAFLSSGMAVTLIGEANDGLGKSMSGGSLVLKPSPDARFSPETQAIVGNFALYGATGGTVFIHGRAGDRFAVRNSGSVAVVEGCGMHGCEYMTGGRVIVLGTMGANAGAGMTGGTLYAWSPDETLLNREYVQMYNLSDEDNHFLHQTLLAYWEQTGSRRARIALDSGFRRMQKIGPNLIREASVEAPLLLTKP